MKTKTKKLSDSRVEITVTLDAEDLKGARKKALDKLAKEVKVEGFRKGKVPVEVAERFIPEKMKLQIFSTVKQHLLIKIKFE